MTFVTRLWRRYDGVCDDSCLGRLLRHVQQPWRRFQHRFHPPPPKLLCCCCRSHHFSAVLENTREYFYCGETRVWGSRSHTVWDRCRKEEGWESGRRERWSPVKRERESRSCTLARREKTHIAYFYLLHFCNVRAGCTVAVLAECTNK